MLTGYFAALPWHWWPDQRRAFLAFAVGIAWSEVLQVMRERITNIVEAALGQVGPRTAGPQKDREDS